MTEVLTLESVLDQLQRHLSPDDRLIYGVEFSMLHPTPRVECEDGFSVSVQASKYNYCTPRNSEGPWTAVELGFPSESVEAWSAFCHDLDDPTGTVYGYVPLELVAEIILQHGGIKKGDW